MHTLKIRIRTIQKNQLLQLVITTWESIPRKESFKGEPTRSSSLITSFGVSTETHHVLSSLLQVEYLTVTHAAVSTVQVSITTFFFFFFISWFLQVWRHGPTQPRASRLNWFTENRFMFLIEDLFQLYWIQDIYYKWIICKVTGVTL